MDANKELSDYIVTLITVNGTTLLSSEGLINHNDQGL